MSTPPVGAPSSTDSKNKVAPQAKIHHSKSDGKLLQGREVGRHSGAENPRITLERPTSPPSTPRETPTSPRAASKLETHRNTPRTPVITLTRSSEPRRASEDPKSPPRIPRGNRYEDEQRVVSLDRRSLGTSPLRHSDDDNEGDDVVELPPRRATIRPTDVSPLKLEHIQKSSGPTLVAKVLERSKSIAKDLQQDGEKILKRNSSSPTLSRLAVFDKVSKDSAERWRAMTDRTLGKKFLQEPLSRQLALFAVLPPTGWTSISTRFGKMLRERISRLTPEEISRAQHHLYSDVGRQRYADLMSENPNSSQALTFESNLDPTFETLLKADKLDAIIPVVVSLRGRGCLILSESVLARVLQECTDPNNPKNDRVLNNLLFFAVEYLKQCEPHEALSCEESIQSIVSYVNKCHNPVLKDHTKLLQIILSDKKARFYAHEFILLIQERKAGSILVSTKPLKETKAKKTFEETCSCILRVYEWYTTTRLLLEYSHKSITARHQENKENIVAIANLQFVVFLLTHLPVTAIDADCRQCITLIIDFCKLHISSEIRGFEKKLEEPFKARFSTELQLKGPLSPHGVNNSALTSKKITSWNDEIRPKILDKSVFGQLSLTKLGSKILGNKLPYEHFFDFVQNDFTTESKLTFKRIPQSELVRLRWTKEDCPAMKASMLNYNQITEFCQFQILSCENASQAALMMQYFIQVASLCLSDILEFTNNIDDKHLPKDRKTLLDFETAFTIVSVFSTSPILRLKVAFSKLSSEYKAKLDKLFVLFEVSKNLLNTRRALDILESQYSDRVIIIPPLSVYTKDLTFICENPDTKEGRLFEDKIEMLERTLKSIVMYQQRLDSRNEKSTDIFKSVRDNRLTDDQLYNLSLALEKRSVSADTLDAGSKST